MTSKGAEPIAGTAEVREDAVEVERARGTIRRTYPIESRVILGLERLLERLRRRPPTIRLALHITHQPPTTTERR